jgi:hypothetical protein
MGLKTVALTGAVLATMGLTTGAAAQAFAATHTTVRAASQSVPPQIAHRGDDDPLNDACRFLSPEKAALAEGNACSIGLGLGHVAGV